MTLRNLPLVPVFTLLSLCVAMPACGNKDTGKKASAAQDTKAKRESGKADQKAEKAPVKKESPGFPQRPLFGDTHLHTKFSFDAGTFGVRLGPDDAYRFAKGEKVTSTGGLETQLSTPLDFLVVSDHSENLGFFDMLERGDERIVSNPQGKRWHEAVKAGGQEAVDAALEIIKSYSGGTFPPDLMLSREDGKGSWLAMIDAAEKHNAPGKFTTFIGYEWTSMPNSQNLHRVVILRDGKDKASKILPFSAVDSDDPEKLWDAMETYEKKLGGKALAIAHNGNLSNGLMFALTTQEGKELDAAYSERRMKFEPLYEVTQIKGDGETHPFLSPNDEFADFETWDKGNLDASIPKKKEMLAGEYAREALKTGLAVEAKTGANPFKFGLIGSTDSHTALATADDDNFFGKHTGVEPSAKRGVHEVISGKAGTLMGWEMTGSGYAAVWAKENTRESIFGAMQRKETYATTGPRMTVRFFGGWDFAAADAKGDVAKVGYTKGVPMGGDLAAPKGEGGPTFLVAAMKDPKGANLDRVQVVKGWVDADGKTQEKVYDVKWSGDRKADAKGKVPAVGNTVNVAEATYENSIGADQLVVTWQDPEFDPKLRAFYYVRVLEIPTPRWTAHDAKRFGARFGKEVPMVTQQRAYTSPIWYTPAK